MARTRSVARVAKREANRRPAADSFVNLLARVGLGAGSQNDGSTYGFNPVTRNRTKLEWAYRSSWIVRTAVDAVADDMTRAGIELGSDMQPDARDKLLRGLVRKQVWQNLNLALKWSRLYGGALVVVLVDGQDLKNPLRLETVGPGQFKGILVLDRWMVQPSLSDLVTEPGTEMGNPKYYDIVGDAPALPKARIHHTRAFRLIGGDLPYYQKMAENFWGVSIVEPMFDRLVAFDSTTAGAAQLIYKAHLRVMRMKGLTDLLGGDADALDTLTKRVAAIAQFQTNEGLSLIDIEDELNSQQYSFSGLADMMLQFGQQISGSIQVPLVRLFGQSPAGLNSTGESDTRNYNDGVRHTQELRLREPVDAVLRLEARSAGVELDAGFWWEFRDLWQLTAEQKASVASATATAVTQALETAVISPAIAARELRQSSRVTGLFSHVTDEYIDELDEMPPAPSPAESREEFRDIPEEPAPSTAGLRQPNLRVVNRDEASRNITVGGVPVYVETWPGEVRRGLPVRYAVRMPCAYGFFRMTDTAGEPGEGIDCYIGPEHEAPHDAWVMEQLQPDSGEFDEYKVFLGFSSRTAALRAYQAAFADGGAAGRAGPVNRLPLAELRAWVEANGGHRVVA